MHKKGALELSINAIVIVILAMTLLGLGLGFIKNMMGNVLDLSESTFEKMKDKLQQDLITGDELLVFSQNKFSMERTTSSLEGYGIKNRGDSKLAYGIKFIPIDCPEKIENQSVDCLPIDSWFRYKKTDRAYEVRAGDMELKRVDIKIPRTARKGDYLIEVEAYSGEYSNNLTYQKYATTEIFLTVE